MEDAESLDSRTAAFLQYRSTEVLSAPRKWPKGSGPGLFKRQPRPLAPRPPPPRGSRGSGGGGS